MYSRPLWGHALFFTARIEHLFAFVLLIVPHIEETPVIGAHIRKDGKPWKKSKVR